MRGGNHSTDALFLDLGASQQITVEPCPQALSDKLFFLFWNETIEVATRRFAEGYQKLGGLEDTVAGIDTLVITHLTPVAESALRLLQKARIFQYSAEDLLHEALLASGDKIDDLRDDALAFLEALADSTAAKDAYRTARRQSRGRFVGFGSQGITNAAMLNAATGVAHGVFNLIGKGLAAIGNSLKKSNKYKEMQKPFEGAFLDLALEVYDVMAGAFQDQRVHLDFVGDVLKRRKQASVIMQNGLQANLKRRELLNVVRNSLNLFVYQNAEAYNTLLDLAVNEHLSFEANLMNVRALHKFMEKHSVDTFQQTDLSATKYRLLLRQVVQGQKGASLRQKQIGELDRAFKWNKEEHDGCKLQIVMESLQSVISEKQSLEVNLRILQSVSSLYVRKELDGAQLRVINQQYLQLFRQALDTASEECHTYVAELDRSFPWNGSHRSDLKLGVALERLRESISETRSLEENAQTVLLVRPYLHTSRDPNAIESSTLSLAYTVMLKQILKLPSQGDTDSRMKGLRAVLYPEAGHVATEPPEEPPDSAANRQYLYGLILTQFEQAYNQRLLAEQQGPRPYNLDGLVLGLDRLFGWIHPLLEDLKREIAYQNPQSRQYLRVEGVTTLGTAFVNRAVQEYRKLGSYPLGPRFFSHDQAEIKKYIHVALNAYAQTYSIHDSVVFLYDASSTKNGKTGFFITGKYIYGINGPRVRVDQVVSIDLTPSSDALLINGSTRLHLAYFDKQYLNRLRELMQVLFGVTWSKPEPAGKSDSVQSLSAPATPDQGLVSSLAALAVAHNAVARASDTPRGPELQMGSPSIESGSLPQSGRPIVAETEVANRPENLTPNLGTQQGNPVKVPWYFWRPIVMILLVLFFFFPFPLLLLWRSPLTRVSGRIIWSLLLGLFTLPGGPVFTGIYATMLVMALILQKPARGRA